MSVGAPSLPDQDIDRSEILQDQAVGRTEIPPEPANYTGTQLDRKIDRTMTLLDQEIDRTDILLDCTEKPLEPMNHAEIPLEQSTTLRYCWNRSNTKNTAG